MIQRPTGEPSPTPGEEVKEEVDHLVHACDYHDDGEDLPKNPRFLDLDDTGRNVRPIWQEFGRVSMYLGSRSLNISVCARYGLGLTVSSNMTVEYIADLSSDT